MTFGKRIAYNDRFREIVIEFIDIHLPNKVFFRPTPFRSLEQFVDLDVGGGFFCCHSYFSSPPKRQDHPLSRMVLDLRIIVPDYGRLTVSAPSAIGSHRKPPLFGFSDTLADDGPDL